MMLTHSLGYKSHSRSHAECVWRDARHVWEREPAAPFGIGEITVVRSAAFHLDSVTGKSARAHLFKRALSACATNVRLR
jgi:hypothetical protein